MSTPCKTSDHGCVYHACMSDHCQKEVMRTEDPKYFDWFEKTFGPGKCEENIEPQN